ncbi:MAG: Crp/Fnr family transcriptional regulator [Chitinophagaceae bacterium]|nr:Crp/Fnr family transcriptional regulator [Chitinophagaceae bacterium]
MEYRSLIGFLKKKATISNEEEAKIRCYFKPQFIKKNGPGNTCLPCNQLYFVRKGLVRAIYSNENERAFTRVIAWENSFLVNMPGFKQNGRHTEIFECIEDAEILAINKQDLDSLLSGSLTLKNIYCELLEEYNSIHLNRLHVLSSPAIKHRMQYLKVNYPRLIGRVSDSILASFLCISRETFVRHKSLLHLNI